MKFRSACVIRTQMRRREPVKVRALRVNSIGWITSAFVPLRICHRQVSASQVASFGLVARSCQTTACQPSGHFELFLLQSVGSSDTAARLPGFHHGDAGDTTTSMAGLPMPCDFT